MISESSSGPGRCFRLPFSLLLLVFPILCYSVPLSKCPPSHPLTLTLTHLLIIESCTGSYVLGYTECTCYRI